MSRYLGPEFDHFLRDILPGLGLDWRRHRRRSVRRRVAERLRSLRLKSFKEYQALLDRDPAERDRLAALMGVTISRFFREADVFDFLAARVWPTWRGRSRVVMFSAGCAGGEEPYTLAMLWLENRPAGPRPVILSMDIDAESLYRARRGVYPEGSLREVRPKMKERYFSPAGREWLLKDEVRDMVSLYRGDFRVLGPPPGLDLALCRNLAFTYFGPEARLEATLALARSLRPGGWLVIGAKEKIERPDLFEAVYPCVFQVKSISRP